MMCCFWFWFFFWCMSYNFKKIQMWSNDAVLFLFLFFFWGGGVWCMRYNFTIYDNLNCQTQHSAIIKKCTNCPLGRFSHGPTHM